MADYRYDLLAAGLENGDTTQWGYIPSNIRLRSSAFIAVSPMLRDANMLVVSSTGKQMMTAFKGYSAPELNSLIFDLGWYSLPHYFDISRYSNLNYIQVILGYSDDSDISPNDIILAEILCSAPDLWTSDGSRLTHNDLPAPLTGEYMQRPFPPFIWYVENGRLTHVRLPSPIDDTPDIPVEYDDPYIRVYDISEPQDGFDHNGLAVLDPISCISNKEFNARWDITLAHPMDKWDKWHWLVGQNILKVKGQLFRINEVENVADGNKIYVEVHAKHISYDLADVWIEYSGIGVYNKDPHSPVRSGKQVLDQLMSDRIPDTEFQGYTFDLHSDIAITEGELSLEIRDMSFIAALIGADNCFANRLGGELYRDNFFLSMNTEMQNSRREAFVLRYTSDMTKIKQKIDYSDWVTFFRAVDNYGGTCGFWRGTDTSWIIHHHKQKRIHFNYSERVDDVNGRIQSDGMAYWNSVNTPKVTYEISIASIKNDPKYKDFLELQNYEVGDTGYVYCEPLQINTLQRVMAVKRDELTDTVISITLGNMQNSLIRPSYMGNTISSGNSLNDKQLAAVQEQMDDLTFVSLVHTPVAESEGEFLVTDDGEFILYEQ